MAEVPPTVQIYVRDQVEKGQHDSRDTFALKWVERVLTWLLYAIGGVVVLAIMRAAAPFIQ